MSVVTRSQKMVNEEVGDGVQDSGTGSDGTVTGNDIKLQMEAQRFELEKLKLQLELERVKLEQLRASGPNVSAAVVTRSRVGEYAKELKAVLAPMPVSEPLVPAWFRNVETMFANFDVPEDVQGAVILPYLTEKMREVATRCGEGGILAYSELKKKVLAELKLTANEYSRLFRVARRTEGESWSQFASNLRSLYDHYLESREVETLGELKELIVADRLKQALPDEIRSYVILNETGGCLKPHKIAH